MRASTGSRLASLGLDFGTESVRAVIVSFEGNILACTVDKYEHGQITHLGGPDEVFQNAHDWEESAQRVVKSAMVKAGLSPQAVVGIGVDFTSCTLLPTDKNGTPLFTHPKYQMRSQAWPKLWKHHGAIVQAEAITSSAAKHGCSWMSRFGGALSSEWLHPKVMEVFQKDVEVFDAAEVFVEAGDWFVWNLAGRSDAFQKNGLVRSACQAGYKGCWSKQGGFKEVHDLLDSMTIANSEGLDHTDFGSLVMTKLPGVVQPPGAPAGELCGVWAEKLGLQPGIPIGTATIDAHAGVPGVGVADSECLVMILGTSGCYLLNGDGPPAQVEGVCGAVEDGIVQGLVGYELGQSSLGDSFAWLSRVTNTPVSDLAAEAAQLRPSFPQPDRANEVLALDWLNGSRSPHNNARLRGAFVGLSLETTPADMYLALEAGVACAAKGIVKSLTDAGVPISSAVATGGLPHAAPHLVQTFANALQTPIRIHPHDQGPAVGAAVLGATASGHFSSVAEATKAMVSEGGRGVSGGQGGNIVSPDVHTAAYYEELYEQYQELASFEVQLRQ